MLEEKVNTFVKEEIKTIQKVLSPDYQDCSENQRYKEHVLEGDDEQKSISEAFVKIALYFLRTMEQRELADCLQKSKRIFL